jgi:TM2 domain-containing membrane protein YozV
MTLENILINWIPLGFGIIGIIILLIGVLNLVGGRERAFNNIFSGIFVILIAIGLRWFMEVIVIKNLL